jgi:4-hydroxy-tetrahydrodipicolinate reductase
MAIPIAVAGAAGRMGGRVICLAVDDPELEVVGCFEREGHPLAGRECGQVTGCGPIGLKIAPGLAEVIDRAEVIIDFTQYEASLFHLEQAAAKGKAIVIGTTGFTPEAMARVRQIGPRTRCVMTPNMSAGVNVMFKIVSDVARVLGPSYDIEIVEAHHRMKKDAPSGTAMKLAELAAKAVGRDLQRVGRFERKGLIGERSQEEIGLQTLRGGDIVGEHTVMFAGIGERLEITHRAHSRDNFARGALRAAKWIVNQPPGLYDMQDVLGIKG